MIRCKDYTTHFPGKGMKEHSFNSKNYPWIYIPGFDWDYTLPT